jgi:hypothetical protein
MQTFRLHNVEPVGTVIVRRNTVQRRLGDRVVWDRLSRESPVYIGDLIRVADHSFATLDIRAASIDLEQNTLVRIMLSPDGKSIRLVLREGFFTFNAPEGSAPFIIESNGRQVITSGTTVLNARADEEGRLSIQINSGVVQFVDENGRMREIASGNILVIDEAGVEQNVSAVVVTYPAPNVRYLNNKNELFPVDFSWNRINIDPDVSLRMEIGWDRNFSRVMGIFDHLQNEAQINLDNGLWYWRISLEDLILSTGSITIADGSGPQLISPAINSYFRYHREMPLINFQWENVPQAVSYVLEISTAPDFSNPQIRRQSSATSLIEPILAEGLWFWRVMPVFPSIFEGYASFSQASFFTTEQLAGEINAQEMSLSEWLAAEAPSDSFPPGVPPELIPAHFAVQETPAPAPAPPLPAPVQPPALLAMPQNLRPLNGTVFGHAQLQSERTIVFNWSSVQGANAYIFNLYHQTAAGRRQIVSANVSRGTSYTVDNFRLLDRGTFVWHVEAVSMGRNNVIERRGRVAQNTFTIDFQTPRPVRIEDTGILYGN